MANTPNYDINYDDKRFTQVESDKKAALNEVEKTYGEMIGGADKFYNAQIDASKQWAETQKQNQQAQTDFAIQKIEQQKAQAEQDYKKEQSGAYVDWQKQSNAYGANAEQMAAQGMANTGYSESAQVSMYNTYQSRVVAAREVFSRAVLNYDNAIKDAQLQNNSILAEIAYEAQQKQLELALQGFQYKNTLLIEKANQKTATEQRYYDRYQDVLDQINRENTLAEQVRQYNANLAEEQRQYNESMSFNKQKEANDKAYREAALALEREKFSWQKAQAKSSGSSGGSSGGGSGSVKKSSSRKSSSGSSSSGKVKGAKAAGKDSSSIRSSKSSSTKVDFSSLNKVGASGKSAKSVNQMVTDGLIKEVMKKDGTISFKTSGDALKSVRNKYLKW